MYWPKCSHKNRWQYINYCAPTWWGGGVAVAQGRSLVRSQLESVVFFIDIKSFRSHYGPGVDSASNRNEYQEYFLGGKKQPVRKADNLPPSCAVVMKSGNWNPLGHSRPVTSQSNEQCASECTSLLASGRWNNSDLTSRLGVAHQHLW